MPDHQMVTRPSPTVTIDHEKMDHQFPAISQNPLPLDRWEPFSIKPKHVRFQFEGDQKHIGCPMKLIFLFFAQNPKFIPKKWGTNQRSCKEAPFPMIFKDGRKDSLNVYSYALHIEGGVLL